MTSEERTSCARNAATEQGEAGRTSYNSRSMQLRQEIKEVDYRPQQHTCGERCGTCRLSMKGALKNDLGMWPM